jgi:hypothetical protein
MAWIPTIEALPAASNDGSERIISKRVLIKTGDYVEIAHLIDPQDEDGVYWVNDAGFNVSPDVWQPLPI